MTHRQAMAWLPGTVMAALLLALPAAARAQASSRDGFPPRVAAFDSGGECRLSRIGRTTQLTASFPSISAARMTVVMIFDSAGQFWRYTETRGIVRMPPGSANLPRAQRDSVYEVAHQTTPVTRIDLNYNGGQGTIANSGGAPVDDMTRGTADQIAALPALGPVSARIARVRRLCGM